LEDRERLQADEPYILVVPTYGGGGTAGAVPRQVIRFLNDEHNRALLRGVIAAGNRNFGEGFCRAGDIIAHKCQVPFLYRFELMGTGQDIDNVRKGVSEFWQRQH
ncbi:class Ib ribonucleoside-diphosphate reductase assembly flavoprotein NrdI, partial [Cronobacter sakazakii]